MYTHTHTRTGACKHMYTHVCIHTRIPTHMYTYRHVHVHLHTCTGTHMYTYTRACEHLVHTHGSRQALEESGIRTNPPGPPSSFAFLIIFFLCFCQEDTIAAFQVFMQLIYLLFSGKHPCYTLRVWLLNLLALSWEIILKNFRRYLRRRNQR